MVSLAPGAALALAACSGEVPDGDNANEATANTVAAANVQVPAPPSATAQSIAGKTDALDFTYAWPAQAAAVPELDGWLRGNAAKIRTGEEKSAVEDKAQAAKNDYPFRLHSYEEKYAVVGDTPRMLVLVSEGYVYTGGAHGMPINTAIIWDKATKKRLATSALIDIPRFASLARTRFCDELDRQREKKRGEPVDRNSDGGIGGFNECVALAKQLVLPVSKGGKVLDTVRVVIGPYEAGPYAEGSYVIDLPVDAGVLGTVKEGYKEVFGVGA